jgi:hypothetical protein
MFLSRKIPRRAVNRVRLPCARMVMRREPNNQGQVLRKVSTEFHGPFKTVELYAS